MQPYSIIIPVYNEVLAIEILLNELEYFHNSGHEIVIVDDGSNDGTSKMLDKCKYPLTLIMLERNQGKGNALKLGLRNAKHNKVVIYDSDRELKTSDIEKLMVLDLSKNILFAMGSRFKVINPLKSSFDWGNFMFMAFFNLLFKSNHQDILCCAKSFYNHSKVSKHLSSIGFEIDVELAALLTISNKNRVIPQIPVSYKRRYETDGKKLKTTDGWKILFKIIKCIRFM